mgnify:FL=1
MNINQFNNIFFIGVAGSGMSAIAQYLRGIGKNVSGSDRYFLPGTPNETREKLEAEGILCFSLLYFFFRCQFLYAPDQAFPLIRNVSFQYLILYKCKCFLLPPHCQHQ